MQYIILEKYTTIDGLNHTEEIVEQDTKQQAESYYYSRLAVAASSATIKHSVAMLDDELRLIHRQTFNHISITAEILDNAGNVVAVEEIGNSDIMQDSE